MLVEAVGVDDNAKATFEIWERDINRADRAIKTISDVAISDGKAEAEWQYEWTDEEEADSQQSGSNKYSQPSYYFTVKMDDCQARSAILGYKDFVEIEAEDAEGNPLKGDTYRVYLANGEVREGKLDGKGYAKIENVPPGKWDVEFPDGALPHETS